MKDDISPKQPQNLNLSASTLIVHMHRMFSNLPSNTTEVGVDDGCALVGDIFNDTYSIKAHLKRI